MSFKLFRRWLAGVAMGSADIVPGISGGTMAFILGIYEELIESVRHLGRVSSWLFLAPVLLGILSAFMTLAGLFHNILNHPESREYLYSLFLGLILASIVLLIRQLKSFSWGMLLLFLFGAFGAWSLTGEMTKSTGLYQVELTLPTKSPAPLLNYQEGRLVNVTLAELASLKRKGYVNETTPIFYEGPEADAALHLDHSTSGFNLRLVAAGMVAITAMLLPGISGSYLLNILGLYGPALAAITDLSAGLKTGSLDLEAFEFLALLGVGILLGAAIFSHAISWLLRHYHELALSLLTGFMLGAIKTVWPFWTVGWKINPLRMDKGFEIVPIDPVFPTPYSWDFFWAIAFLGIGFCSVFLIEYFAKNKATRFDSGSSK